MKLISIAIVILGSTTAARAQTPAWCSAAGVKPQGTGYATAIDKATLRDLVKLTCWPEDKAKERRADIDRARAAYSKRMMMTEADWVDVAQYYSLDRGDQDAAFRGIELARGFSTLSPIEQFHVAGLALHGAGEFDRTYFVDALGPRLSEAGRLRYIVECMSQYDRPESVVAMCQPDIARLDRAKLITEIKADKLTSVTRRMQIRLMLARLEDQLASHAASIKELVEKDPEYGKLFTIADAVRKEWDARWKTDAELLDLVAAMDDARFTKSRKATAGCAEKTWTTLAAAIATMPASRFTMKSEPGATFLQKAAPTIVFEPAGYLAAAAFVMCAEAEQRGDRIAYQLGQEMIRQAGYRGPRSATLMAIAAANIKLDTIGAEIKLPKIYRWWFHVDEGRAEGGSARGVVAKIDTADDTMTVSFPKEMMKTKVCSKSKETNRVVRLRADGGVEYEEVCLAYTTETYDNAPKPVTASTRWAAGVKKGALVEIADDIVYRVWASANATVPSHVFGIPVK